VWVRVRVRVRVRVKVRVRVTVVNWIVLVIVLPSSDSLFTVCVSFTDFLLFVFLPF